MRFHESCYQTVFSFFTYASSQCTALLMSFSGGVLWQFIEIAKAFCSVCFEKLYRHWQIFSCAGVEGVYRHCAGLSICRLCDLVLTLCRYSAVRQLGRRSMRSIARCVLGMHPQKVSSPSTFNVVQYNVVPDVKGATRSMIFLSFRTLIYELIDSSLMWNWTIADQLSGTR